MSRRQEVGCTKPPHAPTGGWVERGQPGWEPRQDPLAAVRSAGLAVEETGLVAGSIEIDVLLIDLLVPVHPIPLRVVPHRMVPPVEEGVGLGVVDRIPIIAPRMFQHGAAG